MRFTVVKLTKKLLNLLPDELLVKIGAWDKELKQTYPQYVFMDSKDYNKYKSGIKKKVKKQRSSIEYYFLMYGPSTGNQKITIPGYLLIDEYGIKEEKKLGQIV